jgi:hypothetical protein
MLTSSVVFGGLLLLIGELLLFVGATTERSVLLPVALVLLLIGIAALS